MEVTEETVMAELDVELLDDVLHDEQLAILDSFLKGLLNVPKHQVLQLGVLCEDPLKAIKVALLHTVDE